MADSANNTPQRLDLSLWRSDDHQVRVTLQASSGAVLPPQGYTWSAPIYESREDAQNDADPVASFAMSIEGSVLVLTLTRDAMSSAGLAMGPYVWGLRADHDGRRRTFLAGSLRLPV